MDNIIVISTFIVSLIMISAGIVGIIYRRNLVAILISIEVILNSVNLDFIMFSRLKQSLNQTLDGQMFALFNILIAAVEITVGLAIIFAIRNTMQTSDIDKLDSIKDNPEENS
ncbi:MAG: NADH-quinone oxidoreductase subunit NuoK [Leptonema sp. (in: bacteria)]